MVAGGAFGIPPLPWLSESDFSPSSIFWRKLSCISSRSSSVMREAVPTAQSSFLLLTTSTPTVLSASGVSSERRTISPAVIAHAPLSVSRLALEEAMNRVKRGSSDGGTCSASSSEGKLPCAAAEAFSSEISILTCLAIVSFSSLVITTEPPFVLLVEMR